MTSLVALLATGTACATRSSGARGKDSSVITSDMIGEQHFDNAYDAVSALRSNWLHTRGQDSFSTPSAVVIYVDNQRLGGVETLKTIPVSTVAVIQHLDAMQATGRWGIGHGAGAIYIETAMPSRTVEHASASATLANDPRFDWFEYTGNDSVYRTVSARPDEYLNPILAGFYPDPSMIRVGDDYYLVTSSFAYFPGVPIFHSRDLVSWTQIGHVLDRRSQLNLDSAGISRGIFAPVIRYNAGTFYMITTVIDHGGNFFVTATNPAGPWSDPVWLPSVDGIDPSFFFDDNGKAYVVNNGPPNETPRYSGHRAIWIQEFDIASKKMVGPRTQIVNGGVDLSKNPIWIEAPHIFKRNGFYYLICAEGGTENQHSEVVFRGNAPTGPWTPYSGNPILTQRHLDRARPFPVANTGHADFVDTPNGEWWAAFLGVRPYGADLYNIGRETFLMPVRWVGDWPVMATGNELVPFVHKRPTLPHQPPAAESTSGNFTVRDDFNSSSLPMHWQTIRGPASGWLDLTSSPGALTLHSRAAGFEPTVQPSFVGRRQQHVVFTATTAMTYAPSSDGDRAGMVAFQNDHFYYFLAVARENGKTVVLLEKREGAAPAAIVASAPVDADGSAPIYLKIDGRGSLYDFSYATRANDWKLLQGSADGTIL
ncbi:MAG: glycoside hydrolase family 43 protein, partial [bacterium]